MIRVLPSVELRVIRSRSKLNVVACKVAFTLKVVINELFYHNEIELAPSSQPEQLIQAYLASDTFGTSFVGPSLEETPTIHGPFFRSSVVANDFQLIDSAAFYRQINDTRKPDGFSEPATEEQWGAVEKLVSELERQYIWLFKLRLTEDNSDRFHEWGFALTVFREFILANANSANVARLVFGYD